MRRGEGAIGGLIVVRIVDALFKINDGKDKFF
jgi:hypothetical protein